jgi:hypothetical protein
VGGGLTLPILTSDGRDSLVRRSNCGRIKTCTAVTESQREVQTRGWCCGARNHQHHSQYQSPRQLQCLVRITCAISATSVSSADNVCDLNKVQTNDSKLCTTTTISDNQHSNSHDAIVQSRAGLKSKSASACSISQRQSTWQQPRCNRAISCHRELLQL